MSLRKNLQQRRYEQAIGLREMFAKLEQDLCDKLRRSMESILVAFIQAHQQPHILPQQDVVFLDKDVEEGGYPVKEIHGAPIFDVYDDTDPIFDVYDDVDPIFDDCVDADPTFHVFSKENDVEFIGIQKVKDVKFGPMEHVQINEEPPYQGRSTDLFHRSDNLFCYGEEYLNNKKKDQQLNNVNVTTSSEREDSSLKNTETLKPLYRSFNSVSLLLLITCLAPYVSM
ncbi:unnamed protein product [Arabis nemorensis]|uniref:Uncharacterized protein n=1 Tax=Arabis nemorensis TaxID=586526 RepID=A0A565BSU8_9BRAS|nr:unnamed protein product [Arabis nemorensis]